MGHHCGKQLTTNALAFKVRQHSKDKNFSSPRASEAVPDHSSVRFSEDTQSLTKTDAFAPRFSGDAEGFKAGARDRVLTCEATQPDVLGCELGRSGFVLNGRAHKRLDCVA